MNKRYIHNSLHNVLTDLSANDFDKRETSKIP